MNKKIPLKELCIEDEWGKYGIPASAEEFDCDKTRYLRITDISEDGELLNNDKKSVTAPDIDKYVLQEGDIVFARTGNSTGKAYYHEDKNGKLAFAGFLIKYSLDKTKVNPKYVKFFTITNEYKNWVKNLSVGSTRGNINAQTFGDCPISLPDRKQQDLLVRTLSLIIAKIELNNRINAELEAMAKTLYDYWFVQFDFPDANGKPYKTSGGKMVWNEDLKREIPEGWSAKTLSYFCQRIGDGIHGTPEYVDVSDYSFINGNNLKNGFISIDGDTNRVSSAEHSKYFIELNEGTILLSINGTLGNLAVYTGEKVMLGKSAAYINCTGKNRPYCFQFLKLTHIQNHFWNIATGSTIKNLSLDSIKNLLVPFPGDNLIERYYDFAISLDEKKKNIFKENNKLSELRDWLLPMLMNGQVKVN